MLRGVRVLVTGATGFLGSRLVDVLRERGLEVRALVRERSDTASLRARGVELAVGSLAPAAGLGEALHGVDAVIHCAGGGRTRTIEDLYSTNRDTTRNLLEAVRAHRPGLTRFVLVSSLAAQGPSPDGTPRGPAAEPAPVTHYGKSKLEAEEIARGHARALPVTIVRPPAVYGPGDTRMLGIFKMLASGLLALPNPVRSASLIYVDDCAAALCDALVKEHPSGSVFCVDDGGERSWEAIAREIGRSVGHPEPTLVRVPIALLSAGAWMSELAGKLRDRVVFLTHDKVTELSQAHWVSDASLAREVLGWAPRVPLAEGAARTAAWFREEGLL